MTEDEVVGWHHRLKGHEFEQALGAGDGQGSLVSVVFNKKEQCDIDDFIMNGHFQALTPK